MKKNEVFCCVAVCFTLFFLIPHDLYAADNVDTIQDWGILANVDITTPRHESFPSISYNPRNNEFMVIWHTAGPMQVGCVDPNDPECAANWHSIDGRRISSEGELLGDQIQLSPPEVCGWKDLPKSAYNIFKNEYMVAFQYTPETEFLTQEVYMTRINKKGEMKFEPRIIYPRYQNASHPLVVFNQTEHEYLLAYNDTPDPLNDSDNIGFILGRNGIKLNRVPFPIGNPAGIQYNPQGVYNSKDNTYLVVWEDFRHVQSYMDNADIYGTLLNADGGMIAEIPIIDDYGTPDEGSQNNQNLAYNPDRNEFLVAWGASDQPSLESWGAVVGIILNGDGTPKGAPFVIADAVKPQNSPQMVYVRNKKKYFIIWSDYRNDTALQPGTPFYFADNVDVYGKWLNPDGTAASEDIPICIDQGKQVWPTLAYGRNRLLILWSDYNASDDYPEVASGGFMVFDFKSNMKGVIYGKPE